MEEKIYYNNSYGFKLCGILNKVNDSDTIVVLCHANGSSKSSRPTSLLSNNLTKNKINNFRFDFIACGESEGKYDDYSVTNMIKDLNDTLNMLTNLGYKNFVLFGASMGGKIVSLVDKKYNIIKLILWYPALDYNNFFEKIIKKIKVSKEEKIAVKNKYFSRYDGGFKLSYNYYLDLKKYEAYKELKKFNCPIFFVHGLKDPYISYKKTIKVSNLCNNSQVKLIEDGDHGFHGNTNILNDAIKYTIKFIKEKNQKFKSNRIREYIIKL